MGEARHDCFSQFDAGVDMAQVHMWCIVTMGEARHDCISQCNAGGGNCIARSRGRRGTICQFESKEACESLCFHNKSECTGLRKLVV